MGVFSTLQCILWPSHDSLPKQREMAERFTSTMPSFVCVCEVNIFCAFLLSTFSSTTEALILSLEFARQENLCTKGNTLNQMHFPSSKSMQLELKEHRKCCSCPERESARSRERRTSERGAVRVLGDAWTDPTRSSNRRLQQQAMCDAAFLLRSAPVVYGHAMPTSLSGGTLTMESPLQTDGRGLGLFPGAARGLQRRSPVTFHKWRFSRDSNERFERGVRRVKLSQG